MDFAAHTLGAAKTCVVAKGYCFKSLHLSGGLIVRVGLRNLGLEFVGTKRLFDETGNARLLGLNDLLYRGIGGHHDEGQIRVVLVCADILEQSLPAHWLHIPIGDHQAEMLLRYLFQRRFSIRCVVDIFESQLRQNLSNDTSDCTAIIHYQNAAEVVNGHFRSPKAPSVMPDIFTQTLARNCDVILKDRRVAPSHSERQQATQ
jgi:hypothetical protein